MRHCRPGFQRSLRRRNSGALGDSASSRSLCRTVNAIVHRSEVLHCASLGIQSNRKGCRSVDSATSRLNFQCSRFRDAPKISSQPIGARHKGTSVALRVTAVVRTSACGSTTLASILRCHTSPVPERVPPLEGRSVPKFQDREPLRSWRAEHCWTHERASALDIDP